MGKLESYVKGLTPHVYYYQLGKIQLPTGKSDRTYTLSPSAIVLMSQLMYWMGHLGKKSNGWVYKTRRDWVDELGMSGRRIEQARKELREVRLIEEKLDGYPSKVYYKVNFDTLDTYMNLLETQDFVSVESLAEFGEPNDQEEVTEKPVKTAEVWVPNENVTRFRDAVWAATDKFMGTGAFFKKDESYVGYWKNVEGYIEDFINGCFVSKHGKDLTKKPSDFTEVTIEQLIDATLNGFPPHKTGDKAPSIEEMFLAGKATYSPIHNYLEKKLGKPSGETKKSRAVSYDLTNQQKRYLDVIFGYATDASGYASKEIRAGLTVDKTTLYAFGSRVAEFIEDNKEQLLIQNAHMKGSIDLANYSKFLCDYITFYNKKNDWKDSEYQASQKLTMDRIIREMRVGNNDNPLWLEFTKYCKEEKCVSVAVNKTLYRKIEDTARKESEIFLPTEKEVKQALYEEGLDS